MKINNKVQQDQVSTGGSTTVTPPAPNYVAVLKVYISQTGNDTNNTGLTLQSPFLTLNRAAELAATVNPAVLKIYFIQPTVTALNLRSIGGFKVIPSFRCDLHLLFAANATVSIGTFTEVGITYPVKMFASKNVLICGDDDGDMTAINSLTLPIIDSDAYSNEQKTQFAAQNGFVYLNTFDYLPVQCKIFTGTISVKKNVFLFKNSDSLGHRRSCHFQHLRSLNEGMAVTVEQGAGIVENFTSVRVFWRPVGLSLGLVASALFGSQSSCLRRGLAYRYSIREFVWDAFAQSFVETGVNLGTIWWPETANTSHLAGNTRIEEFSNMAFASPKTINGLGQMTAYEAVQFETWANAASELTLSLRRINANPNTNSLFEISFESI